MSVSNTPGGLSGEQLELVQNLEFSLRELYSYGVVLVVVNGDLLAFDDYELFRAGYGKGDSAKDLITAMAELNRGYTVLGEGGILG